MKLFLLYHAAGVRYKMDIGGNKLLLFYFSLHCVSSSRIETFLFHVGTTQVPEMRRISIQFAKSIFSFFPIAFFNFFEQVSNYKKKNLCILETDFFLAIGISSFRAFSLITDLEWCILDQCNLGQRLLP